MFLRHCPHHLYPPTSKISTEFSSICNKSHLYIDNYQFILASISYVLVVWLIYGAATGDAKLKDGNFQKLLRYIIFWGKSIQKIKMKTALPYHFLKNNARETYYFFA